MLRCHVLRVGGPLPSHFAIQAALQGPSAAGVHRGETDVVGDELAPEGEEDRVAPVLRLLPRTPLRLEDRYGDAPRSRQPALLRESAPGRVGAVLVGVVEQSPEGRVFHAEL